MPIELRGLTRSLLQNMVWVASIVLQVFLKTQTII